MNATVYQVPEEETLERGPLAALQRRKFALMLQRVCASNSFYRAKFSQLTYNPLRDPLEALPFTTRPEIEADQAAHPPYGTNLTFPIERYSRLHQTSGTGGRPVRWLDTPESWLWIQRCWRIIYAAAGVTAQDRFMFPFSFGPFIGFWAAFEGASAMGSLTLAAGGMTTTARLQMALANSITVIGCTPTYALRMAEVAAAEHIDIANSSVRALIVAGEPGGNIPGTRQRIENAWNARVFDHTGMTEIGSLGFECHEVPGGVHLIESECIPEVIDPATGQLLPDGTPGELVLTNLGRWGSPLIRYRTGDRVTITRQRCACGRWFARLEGGIQGRIDDMVVVRGNNVFPSAIEAILREFAEIAEFQIEILENDTLSQVTLRVEPQRTASVDHLAARITHRLQDALSFRAQVEMVAPDSLPRFEMKARRVIRRR